MKSLSEGNACLMSGFSLGLQKTEAKNAAATSMTDENALKWLYTDPQGEVQGVYDACCCTARASGFLVLCCGMH